MLKTTVLKHSSLSKCIALFRFETGLFNVQINFSLKPKFDLNFGFELSLRRSI